MYVPGTGMGQLTCAYDLHEERLVLDWRQTCIGLLYPEGFGSKPEKQSLKTFSRKLNFASGIKRVMNALLQNFERDGLTAQPTKGQLHWLVLCARNDGKGRVVIWNS